VLRILEQKYYTQTRGVTATDLKACIGEKLTIETKLYSEIVSVSNGSSRILIKPPISTIEVTANNEDVVYIEDSDFVSTLRIGDSFNIVDTVTDIVESFTVKEVISENAVRVNEDL